MSWPEEYGGRGADLIEWLIFEEEYWAAGGPGRVTQNGIFLLAPTIFEFGTKEQQDRYLPKMAAGEELWAQGWSEPDAGSDLAGLAQPGRPGRRRLGADRPEDVDDPGRVLRLALRPVPPDPEAERHQRPDLLPRPARRRGRHGAPVSGLHDDAAFAEVFFEEVRVPSANVLGEVNEGWRVAMATASSERGLTLRSPGRFMAAADRLVDLYRRRPDEHLRDEVAQAWMDAEAYRLLTFQAISRMLQTGRPWGPRPA